MGGRAGESTVRTLLLGALFGVSAGAVGLMLSHRPQSEHKRSSLPTRTGAPADEVGRSAARLLSGGAAALAFSVLADSALEHYRGGFYNRLMFVAPTVAGLTLAESGARLALGRHSATGTVVFGAAILTGLVGSGFHVRNISKREGGWRWMNLFYGAPLAAPMGLVFAGLFGLAADGLQVASDAHSERLGEKRGEWPSDRAGELFGLAAATGLAGTAAEAGLLHFRGAFQDPFMFLPVTLPPLAGAALLAAMVAPRPVTLRAARVLLVATRALGFAGVGFHAFGVHRNMGGWSNWRQLLLQGPPLPAPPSFTGMALAGEAALQLQWRSRENHLVSRSEGPVDGGGESVGERLGGKTQEGNLEWSDGRS